MIVLVVKFFEFHTEKIVEWRAFDVLDDALGGGEVEFLEGEGCNIRVTELFAACSCLYLFQVSNVGARPAGFHREHRIGKVCDVYRALQIMFRQRVRSTAFWRVGENEDRNI